MLNENERVKWYLMENINTVKSITEQNIKDIGEIFVSLIKGEISYYSEDKRYINSVVIANLLYDNNIPNSKYAVLTYYKDGLNKTLLKILYTTEEYKHIYAWIGKYIVQKINRELESMGINQPVEQKTESNQCKDSEIPKPVVKECDEESRKNNKPIDLVINMFTSGFTRTPYGILNSPGYKRLNTKYKEILLLMLWHWIRLVDNKEYNHNKGFKFTLKYCQEKTTITKSFFYEYAIPAIIEAGFFDVHQFKYDPKKSKQDKFFRISTRFMQ